MRTLNESQIRDAALWAKGLGEILESLPDDPTWGNGFHLRLPVYVPLHSDYNGDDHVYAWLVANEFNGYDLTTEDPTKEGI